MRSCVFAILAVSVPMCAAATGDEPLPYIVHVASERAALRSGPGEDYYETSALPHGTPVEVWRQAPGGWLAVRPPKGSFSLVSAADVRLAPNRLAAAVRPEAPARIGSELTADRDVVQVLLEQGERVRVLETITLDGQFWHRVAPPAGEFRWIHASLVSGGAAPAAEQIAETFVPVQTEPAPYRIARFSTAAERRAAGPPEDYASDGFANTLADVVQTHSGAIAKATAVTLADIEVELATIVAEDPQLWRFDHLLRRCDDLLASSDADEQAAFEAVLKKIARFEQIRDKRRAIAFQGQPEANADSNVPVAGETAPEADEPRLATDEPHAAGARNPTWQPARDAGRQESEVSHGETGDVVRIPERPVTPVEDAQRYDGVGTLRPVVSRRREAPRYALVDVEGDVVTFITPSTGVNLQPYVGQRIGVVGTRGYMPEFKRAHVTAARVTPLR